ncbi:hypothetical protein [Novosphingobium sp. KA1]|uniref:hypothetical protein n=1 Tax=Novosphingobium sp. (strain KA1) TaxID=164608 RepID=UPI001A8EB69F|nr:hypothetical protein [Novosphingobium sp. KA1]QSR17451.1 hypothetical protein CA833_09690 [Novosphingobium sp. KA1]
MEKPSVILPPPLARRALIESLGRIEMSADAKIMLDKVMGVTMDAGSKIFEIGRHLLTFVLDLARRFPGTAFALCLALTVSFLIGSVPIVGAFLAPLLTPLLLAFGLRRHPRLEMCCSSGSMRASGFSYP